MNHDLMYFNPLSIAIEGTNLIEASAGTGKTYGIAALFARLVVLEEKMPSRLLVLTFSKAATAELKNRLRARLQQILAILQTTNNADLIKQEPFLIDLFKLISQREESQEMLITRLQAAINEFDSAGIYTIHGFCKSVLSDEAFLCHSPFNIETENNQSRLIEQAAEDFWREQVSYDVDKARLCFIKQAHPHKMLQEIYRYINQRDLITHIEKEDWQAQEIHVQTAWEKVREGYHPIDASTVACALDNIQNSASKNTKAWIANNLKISKLSKITSNYEYLFWQIWPSLNGKIYQLPSYTRLFETLTQMLQDNLPIDTLLLDPKNIERLCNLSAEILNKGCKKNHTINENLLNDIRILADFGEAFSQLHIQQNHAIDNLRCQMIDFIHTALDDAKKYSNQRSFDDLMLDVHRALPSSSSPLARKLAQQWDVLLVDEFQDTDSTQYAIFKTAFADNGIPLFLVGDPKQAIYRFRGADIHTYLQVAKEENIKRFTLAVNYRSHAKIMAALAAFFAREHPFVYDKIAYAPVRANREQSALNPVWPAVQILCAQATDDAKATTCADHIAMQLNVAAQGKQQYQGRPLIGGDIAVLVQSNRQATLVAKALRERNLSGVMIQRESVFSSDEAQVLLALLRFWINPQQAGLLRFVFAGLFAYSAQEIDKINQNEAQMTQFWRWAAESVHIWQKNGIFSAWQYFNEKTALESRLITFRAERTLTNLNQLLEILAKEESQLFGIHALVLYLEQSIIDEKKNKENNQLRLDSDENLISIMTIHTAKGLQFPIVYCPFADKKPHQHNSALQKVHLSSQTHLLAKQQIDKPAKTLIEADHLSEGLRLLYVALTRACDALVLCIENRKAKPDAPFDFLLGMEEKQNTWEKWQEWHQQSNIDNEIKLCEDLPANTVAQHNQSTQALLQAASLTRTYFQAEYTTSFSALATFNEHAQEEQLPIDMAEQNSLPLPQEDESNTIFSFPRGTRCGLCWHEMIERFDFLRTAEEQSTLVGDTLNKYQFDAQIWTDTLLPMLNTLRHIQLHQQACLKDIPSRQRLPEMGFLLHNPPLANAKLRKKLAQKLPTKVGKSLRDFAFVGQQKWLNGFIDLVCIDSQSNIYIIDYKSNYLGSSYKDYHPNALNNAMVEHHYAVQAAIYAFAVKQFLNQRGMDDFHLHIRYLFLRGLQENSDNGIWSWDLHSSDFGCSE